MKMRVHPARACLAAILTTLLAFYAPANGQVIIGTGDDVSYAVIEAEQFALIYEYHYTHDPFAPLDGYTLLSAIDSADPSLSLSFLNFGDEESPNYFLDSVAYGSTTLTSTPFPQIGPFWAQWVSGGEAGYPVATPIDSGYWSFGSGISSPYRTIGPGSWDGFVYNMGDPPPSVSPVPEPQSSVLLLAGITVVLWMLRRRRHEEKRI
jgi:PEP-CTERM motif